MPAAGATLAGEAASTVYIPAAIVLPMTATPAGAAPLTRKLPSEDELHKRAVLVMLPSSCAAHYDGGTGANLNIFMAWYIGTFYNEKGLSIAPISTLLIGGDAKWSFIEDRSWIPSVAAGYYGGFALPFVGGAVQATGVAKVKQTDFHNVSGIIGKRFGPIALSTGALYGIKRAFPRLIPMLRNASFTTKVVPQSQSMWTAYGGLDFAWREQHFKVEAITLPEETVLRPWLVQTHFDGFLGFDIAYLKDVIGYEVIGYYQFSFFRWPDKRQFEKEREKLIEKIQQKQ